MAEETSTKDEFWAQLDALGEDKVREGIAAQRWGEAGHRATFAQEWIDQKDRNRSASVQAAAISAANRAADASERAAAAAERSADTAERAVATARAANTRATIALVIAAASIIAAILIAYLRPS